MSGDKPVMMRSRWKLAFFALLAVNLLVLGVIGGSFMKHSPDRRGPVVRDLGFGIFSEALSGADRKALHAGFRERRPDLRVARRQFREEMTGILQILRQDPFDAGALATAFDNQRARADERFVLGQDLLRSRIEAMTAEERLAFADRLEVAMTHKKPPKDR